MRELRKRADLQDRFPRLGAADFHCRRAEDLHGMGAHAYDTIALPSVAQYFPNIEYLLRVFDSIFQYDLATGGSVFIGDVRSLLLQEAFHASVLLSKAAPADRAGDTARLARKRPSQEQELAIDPSFFLVPPARYREIATVYILSKRGKSVNEMTQLSYDVILPTSGGGIRAAALPWVDWEAKRHDVASIRQALATDRPPVLALRRVANARIVEALASARHLMRCAPDRAVGEIRSIAAASASAGVEPEDLWKLGRDYGYRVDLSIAPAYADGSFDVVFRRCRRSPADISLSCCEFIVGVVSLRQSSFAREDSRPSRAETATGRPGI